MTIKIEDISDKYVSFEGELLSHATLWDPQEFREVEVCVADALKANRVFLVSNETQFCYTDESFDDAPKEALEAMLAGKATEAQKSQIEAWLADSTIDSEDKVWEKITDTGRDNYFDQL